MIKILTALIYLMLQSSSIYGVKWNCANNANGFSFDIEKISGIWYEAARVPPSDVPACVQVKAPKAIENSNYTLQLDYINNVNKQWRPTSENLTFPWNDATQKGIFEIQYGSGEISMNFIFKLVITDYEHLAAVCYYNNFVPSISMFKIMTRQQRVNATIANEVQKLADKFNVGHLITWVEQSERCNSAATILPTISMLLLATIFVLRCRS